MTVEVMKASLEKLLVLAEEAQIEREALVSEICRLKAETARLRGLLDLANQWPPNE